MIGAGAPVERYAYRIAVAGTAVASLLLLWLSLGVGIIGRDGDPANRMYFAVVGIGLAVAIRARFRAEGMARALFSMALAQAMVAAIAVIGGLGRPWSGAAELLILNAFFIAAFAGSAWLFRRAARRRGSTGKA